MLLQKIISAVLLVSFSLPHIGLAQDIEYQRFTLTYSETTEGSADSVVAGLEEKAAKDADKTCGGTATKLSERSHFHFGPWGSYTKIRLTFEFKCV